MFNVTSAQNLQNLMKTFFGGHPKTLSWEIIPTQSGPKIFLASLGKYRQKSFAPPKNCLLLRLWLDVNMCVFCGVLHYLFQMCDL